MALSKGLTVRQVLERSFDLKNYTATKDLCKWLTRYGIRHSNMLDGEEQGFPPSITDAAQKFFQRLYDGTTTPKARTDIDIRYEDEQYTDEQTGEHFNELTNLGLFYHRFASPDRLVDCLLWHSGYLPELINQRNTLLASWGSGSRWKKIVYLGAESAVGVDLPAESLITICTYPVEHQRALQNVYDSNSLFWNVPKTGRVKEAWELLCKRQPLPNGMEDVKMQWIAAADTELPNKQRKLANTQDTLDVFAQNHKFDSHCHYGILTRAPMALRQWLITVMFLTKHIPGFLPEQLSIICSPPVTPISLYMAQRELSNVFFELRKAQRSGINWSA